MANKNANQSTKKSNAKSDAAREKREAEASKAAELAARTSIKPHELEDAEDDDDNELEDDAPDSTAATAPPREPLSDEQKTAADGIPRGLDLEPVAAPTRERKNRRWAIRYLARVSKDLPAFAWAKFGEDPDVIKGFAMQLNAVRERLEAHKPGTPGVKKTDGPLKDGDPCHVNDKQHRLLLQDFDVEQIADMKFGGMQGTSAKLLLADGTYIFVKATRVVAGPRPAATKVGAS